MCAGAWWRPEWAGSFSRRPTPSRAHAVRFTTFVPTLASTMSFLSNAGILEEDARAYWLSGSRKGGAPVSS